MQTNLVLTVLLLGSVCGLTFAQSPPSDPTSQRSSLRYPVRQVADWVSFQDDSGAAATPSDNITPPPPPEHGQAPAELYYEGPPPPSAAPMPSVVPEPSMYDDGAMQHGGPCDYGACDSCGCGACGPCFVDWCTTPFCGTFWLQEDFLLWKVSGYDTPPLVTASPVGTMRENAAVLPQARVLFGDDEVDDEIRPGARFRMGQWFDCGNTVGIEGTFFWLEEEGTNFTAASNGNPALGVPFFNVDPGVTGEDALIVAFTNPNGVTEQTGFVNVQTSSDIYSGNLLARAMVYSDCSTRVDLLGGYRYFRLKERLSLTAVSQVTNAPQPRIRIADRFETFNDFHGAEWGLAVHQDYCRWSLDVIGKVALGVNQEAVERSGQTAIDVAGFDPIVSDSGLFVQQATNTGRTFRDNFAALTEWDVKIGYQMNDWLRLTAGYTVNYLSHVVRPGEQINRQVDGRLLLNPDLDVDQPARQFDPTDIWLYGGSLGVEMVF